MLPTTALYDCIFTLLDFSDAIPFLITTGRKIRRTNIVLKKATSNGWLSSVANLIKQCIVVAKMPDKTMKSTAKSAGDNDLVSFDLYLFIKLKRNVIKIQRRVIYFLSRLNLSFNNTK